MAALIIFAAGFICLLFALFLPHVPSPEDYEDEDQLKSLLLLPNTLLLLVAAVFGAKRASREQPHPSRFALLVATSIGLIGIGGVLTLLGSLN